MPTNLPSRQYITLSEALSWIAFGDARDRKALIQELAGKAFNRPYEAATAKLKTATSMLADAALNGKVKLFGKHLRHPIADAAALVTADIPAISFCDFANFDITIDGLRGGTGLAWLPDENGEWTVSAPKLEEAYAEVMVQRSDIMRLFPSGSATNIGIDPKPLPRLGDGTLKKWYDKLSPDEKDLSEPQLLALARGAFPDNQIVRSQIREFTRGRKRGRKANSR